MYDVIIIGGGITGTMLAYKLARYDLKVALLEKENDIADGATMANSAIVHTGYDPEEGTLKGMLNVKGANQYGKICKDLDCEYKVIGAYIAACSEAEEKHLDVLAARAEKRDIPYRYMTRDEAIASEPNLSDSVTKVLSFPTTAVIHPWEVAEGCMECAINNGTELYLNASVTGIEKTENGYKVLAGDKSFETKYVVNAAGVHAADIYALISDHTLFHTVAKRGEYYVLEENLNFVDHIIFPVPSDKGKGVLAVPTVHGNVLIGPDSSVIADPDDNGNSTQGLSYVRENIFKTMKNVPLNRSIRNFAGVRPSTDQKDFIIEESLPYFINAASIESPGLASAPAIADYIIEIMQMHGIFTEKTDYNLTRKAPVRLKNLTDEEKNELIKNNPAYGKMICRCEQISEGEIIDCIHKPCGARSIKGVKKRLRPGMGRCQGGFCEPRVLEILARELHISPLEVVLDSPESRILESENRA